MCRSTNVESVDVVGANVKGADVSGVVECDTAIEKGVLNCE